MSIPLRPDFTLPACYNVANVQPLQNRIPSFSDETLFYIFYSMPRDIMQELVAEELMGRKWRYHKIERAWLTRDDTYPNPVEVERGISERGVYLWWDTNSWKKVRVSIHGPQWHCMCLHQLIDTYSVNLFFVTPIWTTVSTQAEILSEECPSLKPPKPLREPTGVLRGLTTVYDDCFFSF